MTSFAEQRRHQSSFEKITFLLYQTGKMVMGLFAE